MKTIRNTLAILLVLLLVAVTAAGCGSGTSWIYEADGRQVPAGLYINYMMTALSELEVAEYNAHSGDTEYALPALKDFLKLTTEDGTTFSDHAKKEAARMSAEYLAVEKRFDDLGLTLSAEDNDSISSYVDYVWNANGPQMEENGIGRESVRLYQANQYKTDALFRAMYMEGGENAVSDDEVKALFQTNYAKVDLFYITVLKDEEGNEYPEQKALAEQYFERYKAGETSEELEYEYSSEGVQEGDEPVVKKNPGENTRFLTITNTTSENKLQKGVVDAAVGVPTMTEGDGVYYIFTKKDVLEDPADLETYRETLIYELKTDEFTAYLTDLGNGVTLTTNQSAVNRYTPEKIKVEQA